MPIHRMESDAPSCGAALRGLAVVCAFGFSLGTTPAQTLDTAAASVRAMAEKYCVSCHNPERYTGKLDLESILPADFSRHWDTWADVLERLRGREMPPENTPRRPDEDEYRQAIGALQGALDAVPKTALNADSFTAAIGRHCVRCHNVEDYKGLLDLDAVRTQGIAEYPSIWEKVLFKLDAGQMPPAGELRPAKAVLESIAAHLTNELDDAAAKHPNPGRTDTFRRLNRTEYQNAIRDLLALNIDAAALLPADESSYGFDNVTVADLPPALLTRYVSAAQKISRLAIGAERKNPDGHT